MAARRPRRPLPWTLPGVAFLVLLLSIPSMAVGATTVRPFTHAKVAVRTGTNAVPPVRIIAHGLLRLSVALAGAAAAGARSAGAQGLSGTTRVVPACPLGVCNDSFRGAGAVRLRANDIAAWVEVSFVQPPRVSGTAFGFDVELAVHLSTGWFVGIGYFSSGRTTAAAGQTVHLDLLLDLGTRAIPLVTASEVAIGGCTAAARCP